MAKYYKEINWVDAGKKKVLMDRLFDPNLLEELVNYNPCKEVVLPKDKLDGEPMSVEFTVPKNKSASLKWAKALGSDEDLKEKIKEENKTIIINGNSFESGDEITIFLGIDHIINGKIHLHDNTTFFICHNDGYFDYSKSPEQYGYKYAYMLRKDSMGSNLIFHKFDVQRYALYSKDNVVPFLRQFGFDVEMLMYLKLDGISAYDYITGHNEQGYVELHSKERKKQLPIKLGRLVKKLVTSFNKLVLSNPKNVIGITIPDEKIESIHNKWMAGHKGAIVCKFLTGQDIIEGYSSKNYMSGSCNLQGSCMTNKYENLKLYTHNPSKISLMTLYQGPKVCGRTLIWKSDDGSTYHDKIYFGADWVQAKMLTILKEQGIKSLGSSDIKVSLEKADFDLYPYVDSFYHIHFKKKAVYYDPHHKIKTKYIIKSSGGYITEQSGYIEE